MSAIQKISAPFKECAAALTGTEGVDLFLRLYKHINPATPLTIDDVKSLASNHGLLGVFGDNKTSLIATGVVVSSAQRIPDNVHLPYEALVEDAAILCLVTYANGLAPDLKESARQCLIEGACNIARAHHHSTLLEIQDGQNKPLKFWKAATAKPS